MKHRYKNYEIEAIDDNNYTVNRISIGKKGKSEGVEKMVLVGYFSNLCRAVARVAMLEGNEAPDLTKWLSEYKKTVSELLDAFNGVC